MSDKRTALKKKKIKPTVTEPSISGPLGAFVNTPAKKNETPRKK